MSAIFFFGMYWQAMDTTSVWLTSAVRPSELLASRLNSGLVPELYSLSERTVVEEKY